MPAPPQGPASLLWARTGCPLLRPHALDLGRDRAAAGGHLREGQTHSSPRRSDGTHVGSAPAPGHWLWTVDPRARTREGFRPGHQLGAPSQLGFGPGQGLRTAPPAGPGRGGPTGSSPTRPAHHTAAPGPCPESRDLLRAAPAPRPHRRPSPTPNPSPRTERHRTPARAVAQQGLGSGGRGPSPPRSGRQRPGVETPVLERAELPPDTHSTRSVAGAALPGPRPLPLQPREAPRPVLQT